MAYLRSWPDIHSIPLIGPHASTRREPNGSCAGLPAIMVRNFRRVDSAFHGHDRASVHRYASHRSRLEDLLQLPRFRASAVREMRSGVAGIRASERRRWARRRLVFTDNSQLDPWLVSQIIVECTERLCPLVAIQPAYMHPYSVAKMIASFAHLYRRRLYLNMVAGGFKDDLLALIRVSAPDQPYRRL